MSTGQAVRESWEVEARRAMARRLLPTPGVRAWGAAGLVLAAVGVLAQAFEAVAR